LCITSGSPNKQDERRAIDEQASDSVRLENSGEMQASATCGVRLVSLAQRRQAENVVSVAWAGFGGQPESIQVIQDCF
jgi:hypothetical protein